MLTKRVIPCLDIKDNRITKGIQFKKRRDMGDPIERARFYYEQGADELVLYDITASPEARRPNLALIEQVAKQVFIPFAVAGGIRSVEDARGVLYVGADKVSVNTPALERPALINELARAFGSQAVVVGIDVLQKMVYLNTGNTSKMRVAGRDVLEWAREIELRGAGEIVVNCMADDGMRLGYDIATCRAVADAVSIPVIASGGAGSCEHFVEVFTQTSVSGALAASVFHTGAIAIPLLKQYLHREGVPVRLNL